MARVVLDWPVGGVAKLVMKDPAGRNTLEDEVRSELATALRQLYSNDNARAIVLASDGRNFCTGGDLKLVAGHAVGQTAHAVMGRVNELAQVLDASPKPLVAAVAGHCVGAGAGLALLCDIIVAGRATKISLPFLNLGLVADFGLTYTLPRRLGLHAARRALIEARSFDAPDALDAGLVDFVCDDGEVLDHSIERARLLAEAPAHALLQLRNMLKNPPATLAAALEQEALNQSICFGSEDLREGLEALAAKRRPNFNAPKRPL